MSAASPARGVARPERERAARRPYRPVGSARALWSDRRPEILVAGAAGGGKTRSCLEKLHACAIRWPGMRGLVVRKTRESLTESGLVTFEEAVLPVGSPIARGPQRRMRQAYHYPNGSEVVLGGLDKASRIMSTEFDMVVVLEATELEENDWEALTTRLRNGVMPFQQIVGDCNPGAPHHWLYQRVRAGRTALIESRHEDNPRLWDADRGEWTEEGRVYIARLDALTGVRKDRLRYGRWVQAEGVVYEEFDRRVHLIDRDKLPSYFHIIFASLDWGWVNPGVMHVWGVDGDDRMYLMHEVYESQRLIGWWAEKAQALRDRYGITRFVCDPSEPAYIDQFCQAGLNAQPAVNDVAPGIQAVKERLKVAGDGRPRILFVRDALEIRDPLLREASKPCSVIEEFDSYVLQRTKEGRPVKEEPVKVDDHGLDSARYATMHMERRRPAAAPVAFGPAWGLSGMLNH